MGDKNPPKLRRLPPGPGRRRQNVAGEFHIREPRTPPARHPEPFLHHSSIRNSANAAIRKFGRVSHLRTFSNRNDIPRPLVGRYHPSPISRTRTAESASTGLLQRITNSRPLRPSAKMLARFDPIAQNSSARNPQSAPKPLERSGLQGSLSRARHGRPNRRPNFAASHP